jgi:lysophospholipase L1-like esterase
MLFGTVAALLLAGVPLLAVAQAEPGGVLAPQLTVAAAPQIRVVGFGDSVPSGGACHCTNYVTLLGRRLAADVDGSARIDNWARGGLTTPGVLTQLRSGSVRAAVASADLVVLTVGANDMPQSDLLRPACRPATGLSCYRAKLATLRSNLTRVVAQVRDLQRPYGGRILITGYWNVFLDGAVGRSHGATYVAASDALTRVVNSLVASMADGDAVRYVDIYRPFNGAGALDCTALLAADGDHPNARGHVLIADALYAAVQS